jgi:hypothetical protein
MKKLFLIIFILLSNLTYTQTNNNKMSALSINTGFFIPYSSEVFKSGVILGLGLQHKINNANFILDLNYNFSSHKEVTPNVYFKNTSGTGILEFSGGVRMFFAQNNNLKYFFDLGLGVYVESKGSYDIILSGKPPEKRISESNTTIGGNIGVGVDYPLNNDLDLTGKIKYHLYFGVGEDPFLNPYFNLSAGIKYHFNF